MQSVQIYATWRRAGITSERKTEVFSTVSVSTRTIPEKIKPEKLKTTLRKLPEKIKPKNTHTCACTHTRIDIHAHI